MQREQLENTNIRLDEIKNNLDNSNKHIQGISVRYRQHFSLILSAIGCLCKVFSLQSIFGSIKNYWSSRKSSDDKGKDGRTSSTNSSTRSASVDATPRSRRHLKNALERATTNTDVDEHPGLHRCDCFKKELRSSLKNERIPNLLFSSRVFPVIWLNISEDLLRRKIILKKFSSV